MCYCATVVIAILFPAYIFCVYSLYGTDPEQCIKLCQSLADEPQLDTAIRIGDVFGLMIEHYGQAGNYQQVHACMHS